VTRFASRLPCYIRRPMESPDKGKPGLQRIVDATSYSLAGLTAALRHEAAFRQELIAVAVLAPVGWMLGANGTQRALLVGSLVIVLIVELLNSAIEAVVDRVSLEDHILAKTDTTTRNLCERNLLVLLAFAEKARVSVCEPGI